MNIQALIELFLSAIESAQTSVATSLYAAIFVGIAFLLVGFGLFREYRYWEIQKRLRAVKASTTSNTTEGIELESFSERVLIPMGRSALAGLGRMTPGSNLETLRQQLVMAGNPNNLVVIDLLGMKMLTGILGALLAGLYTFVVAKMPMISVISFSLCGFLIATYIPNFWLKGKIKKRREEMRRALPNALDMLTTMVDAGLGFEMALLRLSDRWHNALTQEFERMLNEMNMGVRRVEALRNLAERNDIDELRTFVAVLIQADSLGISVAEILHTQSEQMRLRRRQWIQEQANQLPIKMLPIIAMFILPALFAVILGPAIPVLVDTFSGL
ncbi:type II secretion system F family protein [bacterium]|nr:type II secretion system F family protein [bacterium]